MFRQLPGLNPGTSKRPQRPRHLLRLEPCYPWMVLCGSRCISDCCCKHGSCGTLTEHFERENSHVLPLPLNFVGARGQSTLDAIRIQLRWALNLGVTSERRSYSL